jgi:hypothetical protein
MHYKKLTLIGTSHIARQSLNEIELAFAATGYARLTRKVRDALAMLAYPHEGRICITRN